MIYSGWDNYVNIDSFSGGESPGKIDMVEGNGVVVAVYEVRDSGKYKIYTSCFKGGKWLSKHDLSQDGQHDYNDPRIAFNNISSTFLVLFIPYRGRPYYSTSNDCISWSKASEIDGKSVDDSYLPTLKFSNNQFIATYYSTYEDDKRRSIMDDTEKKINLVTGIQNSINNYSWKYTSFSINKTPTTSISTIYKSSFIFVYYDQYFKIYSGQYQYNDTNWISKLGNISPTTMHVNSPTNLDVIYPFIGYFVLFWFNDSGIYNLNITNNTTNYIYSSPTIYDLKVRQNDKNGNYTLLWSECNSTSCTINSKGNNNVTETISTIPCTSTQISLSTFNNSWMACYLYCKKDYYSCYIWSEDSRCIEGTLYGIFTCINGIWKIVGSVNISEPTSFDQYFEIVGNVSINSNFSVSDKFIINGDVNVNNGNFNTENSGVIKGSLTIDGKSTIGITSSLYVSNCVDLNNGILSLQLNSTEGEVVGIYYNCSKGSFSNILVNFNNYTLQSCETVNTQQNYDDTKLVIFFKLDKTGCDNYSFLALWEIILIVVLPSLAITVAFIFLFVPSLRKKFFPYRDTKPDHFIS